VIGLFFRALLTPLEFITVGLNFAQGNVRSGLHQALATIKGQIAWIILFLGIFRHSMGEIFLYFPILLIATDVTNLDITSAATFSFVNYVTFMIKYKYFYWLPIYFFMGLYYPRKVYTSIFWFIVFLLNATVLFDLFSNDIHSPNFIPEMFLIGGAAVGLIQMILFFIRDNELDRHQFIAYRNMKSRYQIKLKGK
jgi:hypothetical protein